MNGESDGEGIRSEQVRASLRSAFAEVACPYESCDLPDGYWRDMREHLWDLLEPELRWELPRILASLLDDPERENILDVISFLDVHGPPPQVLSEHVRAASGHLREHRASGI